MNSLKHYLFDCEWDMTLINSVVEANLNGGTKKWTQFLSSNTQSRHLVHHKEYLRKFKDDIKSLALALTSKSTLTLILVKVTAVATAIAIAAVTAALVIPVTPRTNTDNNNNINNNNNNNTGFITPGSNNNNNINNNNAGITPASLKNNNAIVLLHQYRYCHQQRRLWLAKLWLQELEQWLVCRGLCARTAYAKQQVSHI